MGFLSTILGLCGFGVGISSGLVVGRYFFIYFQPTDVKEVIKDQVANMYLWPRTLEVQILDPTKATKRPVGILHVKVLRAAKLKKKDLLGASDPYVKLKLTESKLPSKKTTVFNIVEDVR